MIKVFNFDNSTKICSNTYVIGDYKGPCVVIDLGNDSDEIINYVKKNHTSCLGILLTHGHFDHIRGINHFLETFNCTVFIDEKEVKFLKDSNLNCSMYANENINVDTSNIYLLDDEDEINFGNKYYFKVIETPFHTIGSVCYLLKSENALFSGDTLFRKSIGRTDLPTGNQNSIKTSLKKLLTLEENYDVYPGHGDITNLEYEKKYNNYLKEIINDD